MIEFNCNQSLLRTVRWIIRTCLINCSNPIQLDRTISVTSTELYIPARILDYGIYELQFSVTMTKYPSSFTTSSSIYIRIISSDIIVNLLPLGTSMITHGYEQNLILDPGSYSIDLDNNIFNASVSSE